MKKYIKYIPYLLIVIYVGWFCMKFFVNREMPKNDPQGIDWSELKETKTTNDDPLTLKVNEEKESGSSNHELLNSDEEFKLYDEMETKWLGVTKDLFGEKLYEQYLQLRERNEKEKLSAYEDYHAYLKNKYGDKFSYNISEDQNKREIEINKQFLRELQMLIGDSKYKAYLEARDKINEEYLKDNKLFMQIEF